MNTPEANTYPKSNARNCDLHVLALLTGNLGVKNLLDPKNELLARGPIARPDLFVLVRIEEPVPGRPDQVIC